MKGPSKTPDSKRAPRRVRAALIALALGLAGCGSSSKPASTSPSAGKRVELPEIHDAPGDGGAPKARVEPTAPAPPAFPRTLALSALAEGERIADLAALPAADRYLLAWVTYFDGGMPTAPSAPRAAGKKGAPAKPTPKADVPGQKLGATVAVRALDLEGETLGDANVISVKAVSAGGVSLAPAASQGEAALAWVGRDAGAGQVFVTRLSRKG